MATLRAMHREIRKVHLELPAVTTILKRFMQTRWTGTLHMSTLGGQMNMTTLTGYTAHVNTTAHCTCQQHPGTLDVSTPRHTAHVNNTRVHWTCQHHGTLHASATPGHTARVNNTGHTAHVNTSWTNEHYNTEYTAHVNARRANEHSNKNWTHCTCQH